ncbi:MAG: hypothetical protein MUP44_06630, partial [Anaerolineales bacterium]|nr:hypothetical protein [Anaerolineales bacterium]
TRMGFAIVLGDYHWDDWPLCILLPRAAKGIGKVHRKRRHGKEEESIRLEHKVGLVSGSPSKMV